MCLDCTEGFGEKDSDDTLPGHKGLPAGRQAGKINIELIIKTK